MNDLSFATKVMFPGLEDMFRDLRLTKKPFGVYPKLNIQLGDTEGTIEATVPGLTKDDIKVEWEKDTLTIKYQKKYDKLEENKQYYLREIHQSTFERSINLPKSNWKYEDITAKVENGLLTIKIPYRNPVKKEIEEKKLISVE